MTDEFFRIAAGLVGAYLIGAIPFALIVSRIFYRTDVRQHGSGNMGATNIYRVFGLRAAVVVFFLDAAKGAAAVGVNIAIGADLASPALADLALIGGALAAVLGHSYSPYVGFAGGKGVATGAGAIALVAPPVFPVLLGIFALIVWRTRIVSLGSIAVAVAFPLIVLSLYADRPVLVAMSAITALLVLWRHRANIARILRNEEARIGKHKTSAVTSNGEERAE